MAAVRTGTGKWVLGKDYDALVADYDNVPASVYPGSIGTQYRSTGGYDVSAIFDDAWPHRTAAVTTTAPGAPVWPSGTVLQLGAQGAAVEALQRALNDADLYGSRGLTVDGSFGTITQTAVRNFEASEKLTVDSGVAGAQVRNALIRIGHLLPTGVPVG